MIYERTKFSKILYRGNWERKKIRHDIIYGKTLKRSSYVHLVKYHFNRKLSFSETVVSVAYYTTIHTNLVSSFLNNLNVI